ncbi:zinc transporter ZntB [Sphingomonas solaris]|uniref:Zinc transporter ZntB n=1 Tax=Alterirhizorhabdus solaris TaxID=2529389 RepID=A0A558R6A8_9SPHN|nr:zinc transporter ZntB [Sphingomonas solaris]TVV74907.1 zinc transporter ZntB [Sphingomonas solaris]
MRGAPAADAAFVWCHIDGRDEEQRRWLETDAGLSAPVVVALTAVETRPRCEPIEQGALINLRGLGDTPEDDPDPLVSIRLWAEQGRVISVSYRTLAALAPVHARMDSGAIRDPGDLVSSLAVEITHALDPEVVALGDTIDECEASLDADQAWLNRRAIGKARSLAISYRRFVVPQRQALERMAQLDAGWLEDDDRLHLREAADRFARMAEELESVRERSALLHEQLSDLRSELIETRSLLLSIVALVFLPLTFLTGLFGMNVGGIPFANDPHGFEWLVLICLGLTALISAYFIRAHWLRK